MKIKLDFVTNSSSASFILHVEANTEDLNDFVSKFNDFMEFFLNDGPYRREKIKFWNPSQIKKISNNKFAIHDYTGMYNSQSDIPSYMRWLIVSSFISKGDNSFGFKATQLSIMNGDEYED